MFCLFCQGLFTDNKEKMIQQALQSLISRELEPEDMEASDLEALFQALRRLIASKAGFSAFTALQGWAVYTSILDKSYKISNRAFAGIVVDFIGKQVCLYKSTWSTGHNKFPPCVSFMYPEFQLALFFKVSLLFYRITYYLFVYY